MPQYPSYIGVTDVATRSHEHMRVEAFCDGQASILADEPVGFDIGNPAELKGQSRGWTPVHYQLAGLSTCTSITVAVVARDQGFRHAGLRTSTRSLIDIRGFFFDLHLQPKFEQISLDLWLDTQESDERIQALADETDRRCPQLAVYRLAKVPLRLRWRREATGALAFERLHSFEGEEQPEQRLLREAQAAS
jgi:uncharacterized OsmC-like protein